MKLFGIAGRKQVGKDTLGKFIEMLLPDKKVKRLSLAYPLKAFCIEAFDIPPQCVWGSDDQKNKPLCTWGEIFTEKALDKYKKQAVNFLSAREILQVVGTDVMRQGNLDYLEPTFKMRCLEFVIDKFGAGALPYNAIWMDLLKMDIKLLEARNEADVAVITDVRFHNERKMVEELGGTTVRLYRDTGKGDSIPHPSELELEEMDDNDFDHVLYEHENKTLKLLRIFATRLLMDEDLLGGGLSAGCAV